MALFFLDFFQKGEDKNVIVPYMGGHMLSLLLHPVEFEDMPRGPNAEIYMNQIYMSDRSSPLLSNRFLTKLQIIFFIILCMTEIKL